VTAPEQILLQPDTRVFDPSDDAIRSNANERDNRRAPTFHFRFEPLASSAKLIGSEFIRPRGGPLDNIGDPEPAIKKKRSPKRRKQPRRKTAPIKRRPKPIPRPPKMPPNRRRVQPRINPSKKDNQVFRDEIRNKLIMRSKNLRFGRLPGCWQCALRPFHSAAFYKDVSPPVRRLPKESPPARFLVGHERHALFARRAQNPRSKCAGAPNQRTRNKKALRPLRSKG
jgi:hypothetical protein